MSQSNRQEVEGHKGGGRGHSVQRWVVDAERHKLGVGVGRDSARLRSGRNPDARNQRWGRSQSLRNRDKDRDWRRDAGATAGGKAGRIRERQGIKGCERGRRGGGKGRGEEEEESDARQEGGGGGEEEEVMGRRWRR